MKLTILQENLKKALSLVSHITGKNINLPILNNILIRADKGNIEMISTNLEIGIIHQLRGKIEKEGSFTVDAKIMSDYANLLPSDKVEMEEKDGCLKVGCQNYKTKIKGEAATEFPLIPLLDKKEYFSCSAELFRRALSSVAFSISTNDNRVELSGVLFKFEGEDLTLVATDSYRLAEKTIKIKRVNLDPNLSVIVPARTIQELNRILSGLNEMAVETEDGLEIKFFLSENQILFSVDSTDLVSRLINGNYPDYKQIIPSNTKSKMTIERGELLRAVKASAIFSKAGINDVGLELKDDKVIISSSSGLSGESRIELPTEVIGSNNEMIINFKYLIDGLNNISGDRITLEMVDGSAPCLLKSDKDDNYLYIVMPIRQ